MSVVANLVVIGIGLAFMILRRSVLGGAAAGSVGAATALDPSGMAEFSGDVLNLLIPVLSSIL